MTGASFFEGLAQNFEDENRLNVACRFGLTLSGLDAEPGCFAGAEVGTGAEGVGKDDGVEEVDND